LKKNVRLPKYQISLGNWIIGCAAVLVRLGCDIERDPRRHHDARFDVNEACFPIGAAILAAVALRYLRGEA
jgi:metal-dependent amidase/aminoacylase/carboxypeptidase family protein